MSYEPGGSGAPRVTVSAALPFSRVGGHDSGLAGNEAWRGARRVHEDGATEARVAPVVDRLRLSMRLSVRLRMRLRMRRRAAGLE